LVENVVGSKSHGKQKGTGSYCIQPTVLERTAMTIKNKEGSLYCLVFYTVLEQSSEFVPGVGFG